MVEVLDVRNMTINEINNEIEKLENDIDYYLSEKERIFDKTQPKAGNMSGERVQGDTTREDKFLNYVVECDDPEYKALDEKLIDKQSRVYHLVNYMNKELKRMDKYNDIEKLIIYYKEEYKPDKSKKEKMPTWEQIARKVNYSKTQCRRIYKSYKQQRSFK
jgi:hypothetical protein